MPPGENGEAGEVGHQREKNLQMNEIGSIIKAWISVDILFLSIQSENTHQYILL